MNPWINYHHLFYFKAVAEEGTIPTATYTVTRQVLSGELVEVGVLQGVSEELFLVTAHRKIENTIAEKLMESYKV